MRPNTDGIITVEVTVANKGHHCCTGPSESSVEDRRQKGGQSSQLKQAEGNRFIGWQNVAIKNTDNTHTLELWAPICDLSLHVLRVLLGSYSISISFMSSDSVTSRPLADQLLFL